MIRDSAGFRKGSGTRDQIANIHRIIKKAREFQKNVYFCFIDYAKAFVCVDHNKLWKILKEMGIPDHLTCLCVCVCVCVCVLVAQSCPTLCSPIDRNSPGSSIHGIFQARTPEWVAISSKGTIERKKVKSLSRV